MNIKYKIKLVEVLRLRPADLDALDSVILSDSCLEAIMKDDRTILDKELGAIAGNEKVDEKTRLVAASLKSLLLWNTASDELDNEYETMMLDDSELDELPVEETWESKLYKENQANAKEREMAFKEGKKLLGELSVEELTKRYCEYTMQKYPQLKDGFDNGLYRMGMADFHEHLGLRRKEYLLPSELNNKEYMARRGVMDGLNKLIDEIFISELDYWKREYKTWLENRHESRISKKSLKMFFEEKGKHPSDKVLDRMKMEL
jgi:hypothetical protein